MNHLETKILGNIATNGAGWKEAELWIQRGLGLGETRYSAGFRHLYPGASVPTCLGPAPDAVPPPGAWC